MIFSLWNLFTGLTHKKRFTEVAYRPSIWQRFWPAKPKLAQKRYSGAANRNTRSMLKQTLRYIQTPRFSLSESFYVKPHLFHSIFQMLIYSCQQLGPTFEEQKWSRQTQIWTILEQCSNYIPVKNLSTWGICMRPQCSAFTSELEQITKKFNLPTKPFISTKTCGHNVVIYFTKATKHKMHSFLTRVQFSFESKLKQWETSKVVIFDEKYTSCQLL